MKDILGRSNLFKGLSDAELEKLLPLCREEVYEAGTTIFSEGSLCDTMYIVKSGKVALEINLHISRAGEESATIDIVTRGGFLGYSALIAPYIFTATGRTLEATKVIALDAAGLRCLLKENPQIGFMTINNLAAVVSSRYEHTRETLERILSIAFHDLKAPLAAVESYHRVMLGGFAGELNEEQRIMLQSSSRRISDLLNLITNIMDVSRVVAKDLAMSKISLAQVIMDSAELMRPLAEEKGIQLKAEVADGLPPIYGAADRLKQVVTNLLSNGINFTPTEGVVTVKAKGGTDLVQVEVRDTGIGIPAEELPRIFDDFYRGLSSANKGAGLGLSIAKRIIEAHGGKIWAVSPPSGKDNGSEFIFTLPKNS